MANLTPRLHLVCYDIADPKRLGRLHRYLVKRAIPVQYSVFIVFANTPSIGQLLREISTIIDAGEDDVRCYPLPSKPEHVHLGRQLLPDGATLSGAGPRPELWR